jgi:hypothetical protein
MGGLEKGGNMNRKLTLLTIVLVLMAAAIACNLPTAGSQITPTVEPSATIPITPTMTETPAPTPTSTATPAPPTNTPLPSPTVVQTPCNLAEFVMDVNYPDDTHVNVGTTFTKTWQLKNIGSCTWDTSYNIVFVSGDDLNAPDAVSLTGSVPPGSHADLSVHMKAPNTKGTYQAYFKLRSGDSTLFGVGAGGATAFWVKIRAVKPNEIPVLTRNLKLTNPRMQGDDVLMLQKRLIDLGYVLGTADGIFGPKTATAVQAFQSDNGLTSDGIVGQTTWAAIFN